MASSTGRLNNGMSLFKKKSKDSSDRPSDSRKERLERIAVKNRAKQVEDFIQDLDKEQLSEAADLYNDSATIQFVVNSMLIIEESINKKAETIGMLGKVIGKDIPDDVVIDMKKAMMTATLLKAVGKEAFDKEM